MRNFARINNYYNNQEAWKDWLHLIKQAHMASRGDLVKKHNFRIDAGWRTIDKRIAALRADLQAAGITCTKRGDSPVERKVDEPKC